MKGQLYISKATVDFDKESLNELACLASERNAQAGISGYLYFSRSQFLQYLEGAEEEIDLLMSKIFRDDRHSVLHRIVDTRLPERRFPVWNMRWVRDSEVKGIGFEELLADHVLLMRDAYSASNDPSWELTAWRLVSKLSAIQSRFTNLTG